MSRKSFILHKDTLSILDQMDDKERGELFYAIYKYQIGEEVEMSKMISFAFHGFRQQFERDAETYAKQSERNKANGKKGGRPKATKSEENQTEAKESEKTHLKQEEATANPNKAKKGDSDSDSDSDSDKYKSIVYEKFKKVLNDYFIEHQVNTFKSKLNYSIAYKEFDKRWSRYEVVADAYAQYVKRNKSKAVRLDKFLIAYKEDSVKDIEYALEQTKSTFRKPQPQVGSYGWMKQQAEKAGNTIDVEVLNG